LKDETIVERCQPRQARYTAFRGQMIMDNLQQYKSANIGIDKIFLRRGRVRRPQIASTWIKV
jgi:hypothetical protein